jgi:CTP:molybdopterin cytidylyltransferase MocA
VVLAAGQGRRFGATKQVAEVDGLPLVAHAVQVAHAAGIGRVLVVVGHDAEAVATAARRGGPVEVVVNPDPADGQSTSLRAGIAAAGAVGADDVAVVLLADQPGVGAGVVRDVVGAIEGDVEAARARYDDGAGHPVAFARRVWPRLTGVTGDRGARDLLADLATVEVAVSGVAPRDVDRPDDLSGVVGPTRGGGDGGSRS